MVNCRLEMSLVPVLALGALAAQVAPATAGAAPPYLGQEEPGSTARVFAPGVVSTDGNEHLGPTFSPDAETIVWSVRTETERGLRMTTGKGDVWTKPQPVLFDVSYQEDGPYFAPDGSRLFFFGQRPHGDGSEDWDIWYVERTPSGWGEPVNIGEPVNTPANEAFHAVAADGTLYYCTLGPPRVMHRAAFRDGAYEKPEPMPDAINEGLFFSSPFISPDQEYLIFSSEREGGFGSADLFVTRRLPDGGWSAPRNLGPGVNGELAERCPMVSPDGKYLFFVRHRPLPGGRGYYGGDIFWVDAAVLAGKGGD